ncbi:MAG: hypothetical protein HY719_06335 [Planctomycetes bacterium]|nr:hypothetical protein [Planctomycetota bacterium]
MKSYETSATVEDHGRVEVVGVPFAAGAPVEVTISPKVNPDESPADADDDAVAQARARMRKLFRAVKGFRLGGKIPREELYDR